MLLLKEMKSELQSRDMEEACGGARTGQDQEGWGPGTQGLGRSSPITVTTGRNPGECGVACDPLHLVFCNGSQDFPI